MEAAASIVGLLAVGAKLYAYLEEFVSSCADAPTVAQVTCDEVRDFRYALQRLRPYIDQSTRISPLGAAVTDVNQLSLTLASCVVTFSHLEKTLDRLLPRKQMDTIGRLRWTMASGNLSQLITRVQQHKLTLTLLLTIWMSESSAQTEENLGRLNDTLIQVTTISQEPPPRALIMPISEEPLEQTTDIGPSSSVSSGWQNQPQLVFESVLFTSKPYKGIKRTSTSTLSLRSSQRRGTQWSVFSGGSNTSVFSLPYTAFELSGTTIAETPNISTISLPMEASKLHNAIWYSKSPLTKNSVGPMTSVWNRLRQPTGHESLLLDAVRRGDIAAAIRGFLMGASVDTRDNYGMTMLHLAIKANNRPMAETLLDWRLDMNAIDYDSSTALHLAVRLDHKAMVETLLDRGADTHKTDYEGNTSLDLAAKLGHAEIVEVLLDRGADIETTDSEGRTALYHAITLNHESLAVKLLDRGACLGRKRYRGSTSSYLAKDLARGVVTAGRQKRGNDIGTWDHQGKTALLHLTPQHNNLEIAQTLLDRGVAMDAPEDGGNTALHISAVLGHVGIVKLLLDRGVAIDVLDDEGNTALHFSALLGHLAIVELLLDRGADIDRTTNEHETPLHLSLRQRQPDTARLLLNRGANVNVRSYSGTTALHLGAYAYTEEIFKLILNQTAEIGCAMDDGKTALHISAYLGKEEAVKLLLDRGVKMEIRDCGGNTPLHEAVYSNQYVVKQLLGRGAEIDSRNNDGHTPLHIGARLGMADIVSLLLDQGAGVEIKTNNGYTPLNICSSGGFRRHVATVRVLLDHGAIIESKTDDGRTPLDIAMDSHSSTRPFIVNLLLERGAKMRNRADIRTQFRSNHERLGPSDGGRN